MSRSSFMTGLWADRPRNAPLPIPHSVCHSDTAGTKNIVEERVTQYPVVRYIVLSSDVVKPMIFPRGFGLPFVPIIRGLEIAKIGR